MDVLLFTRFGLARMIDERVGVDVCTTEQHRGAL
jgi:hypothetical protein